MSNHNIRNELISFGPFRLNTKGRVLLRENKVIPLQPKAVEMLIALVERQGTVVSKEDLLKRVWPDTFVEESNLTLNISALRKALGDNAAEPTYIETIPRRGYRFNAITNEIIDEEEVLQALVNTRTGRTKLTRSLILAAVILVVVVPAAILFRQKGRRIAITRTEIKSAADEAEVKRVVKDSQLFETLTLYKHPEDFDESQLKKYWLSSELGGKEIADVRASIERLRHRGAYYGQESRLERFDFTYVRIFAPGDHAEVGTLERWYLPMYERNQRVLDRNEYFGPYAVDYTLQKVAGMWLIEKTNTPRATN